MESSASSESERDRAGAGAAGDGRAGSGARVRAASAAGLRKGSRADSMRLENCSRPSLPSRSSTTAARASRLSRNQSSACRTAAGWKDFKSFTGISTATNSGFGPGCSSWKDTRGQTRLNTSVNDSLSTGMGERALSAPAGPKSATASSRNGRAGGASDELAPKPIRGLGGFAIGLRSLQSDLKGEVDVLALHLQRRPQRQLHRPLRGIARGFRQLDPNRLFRSGKRDEERVQPVAQEARDRFRSVLLR